MAKFTPQKIDLDTINNGNRYGFEGIHPDAINRPIEASAYAQEIAESVKGLALNQPDSSQADIVGTPTVEISGTGENAKFVFKSLKGEQGLTGPSGVASGTVNSNAEGTSDTDGYTQQAVNKIASRPNLIINPDLTINLAGHTSYTSTSGQNSESVTRWYIAGIGTTYNSETKMLSIPSQYGRMEHTIKDWEKFIGETLTYTLSVSNVVNKITMNIYTGSNILTKVIDTDGVYSASVTIPTTASVIRVVIINQFTTESSCTINYAKLEVGSVATTYIAPLYEEEIWKCNATYGEPAPLSNPNLLINPDFSINQRGEEFYVADDSNFYTVDRIYLHKYAIPVLEQKNGGGISLSGTSVQAQQFIISYLVEEFKKYAGKTLTLSIKFKNVTGTGVRVRTSSTGTGDYSASITTDMLYTKTFTVAENPTELSIRLTTGVAGDFSFDVDWWKLEVGSVATAFVPPLIAEELPKCQRYYQRFTTNSDFREYGIGFIASTTSAHFSIPLCCEMRISNPTLNVSNVSHFTVGYGSNNGNVVQTTISKMELRSYSKSGFFVTATLANTLSFEYGVASLRPNNIYGYISLNAEIYN